MKERSREGSITNNVWGIHFISDLYVCRYYSICIMSIFLYQEAFLSKRSKEFNWSSNVCVLVGSNPTGCKFSLLFFLAHIISHLTSSECSQQSPRTVNSHQYILPQIYCQKEKPYYRVIKWVYLMPILGYNSRIIMIDLQLLVMGFPYRGGGGQ